jgi:hypothetical protein
MIEIPARGELVCGDAGRRMFFDYVGHYFSGPPRLPPLPSGTPCPRCGSTGVQLWLTSSNEPSCLVQQTITRKRKARTSADEPLIPAKDPAGKTNIGDGNMVVAGPHIAKIITKVLPDTRPLPSLEIVFTKEGCIRDATLGLLRNPPKPPFVVIIFEKKAAFTSRITVDHSQIFINAIKPQVINRFRLNRLITLAKRIGNKELYDLIQLRHRLAGGETPTEKQQESDQAAILAIRASGILSQVEFRTLPDPRSDEVGLLKRIID